MSEATGTITPCANCGIQIVGTHGGYVHIPRIEDPPTDCTDPRPPKTRTKAVTAIRRTTPGPFAGLACILGHTYRVVLENNQPIALECVNCAVTWKTERTSRSTQDL